MADFYQNGIITTIQDIKKRPVEDFESDILNYAKNRKIALILPALYSEFERPAMYRILEVLKDTKCIHMVVLSLDQATKQQFKEVKNLMSSLPQRTRIVWNHGDRVQSLYDELLKEGFPLNIPGKGRVVWMALGYVLAENSCYAIALHDCDIVNYEKGLVEKLVYPVVHRGLSYEFSKGYYARVTDKLYGRVTRLFYVPLVRALRSILGQIEFLDYLVSFRYALSGEFAIIKELARNIRFSPTWGLEVSLLSEIYYNSSVNRICEVEIMDTYEHKHSEVRAGSPDSGLIKMASDIAKTLFRILSQHSIVMSNSFFRTLTATYFQEARKAIEAYNAMSKFNGLKFDRHVEINTVEIFSRAIDEAKEEFVANPIGIRLISPWARVESGLPFFLNKLYEYVELDNTKE
ncbi:MAG: glycosyl transferase [Deferribacterota bacterium]|nr:glycosyl transferase [Deferribacterota bacterium]